MTKTLIHVRCLKRIAATVLNDPLGLIATKSALFSLENQLLLFVELVGDDVSTCICCMMLSSGAVGSPRSTNGLGAERDRTLGTGEWDNVPSSLWTLVSLPQFTLHRSRGRKKESETRVAAIPWRLVFFSENREVKAHTRTPSY